MIAKPNGAYLSRLNTAQSLVLRITYSRLDRIFRFKSICSKARCIAKSTGAKANRSCRPNESELLQKNAAGNWILYGDGRGKQTFATWHLLDQNGELICYAIFAQKGEWFELQVSSAFYNKFLNANNVGWRQR
jgi:hypothetical protein